MEIREYVTASGCDHRRLLRRCRGELVGQCQYCARGFCSRHGIVQTDGQEICVLPRCERLRADVAAHLVFKEAARSRNADRLCGEPECGSAAEVDCERCRCRYCAGHMRQVIMTIPRGGELQAEAVAICDHCRARLPLWTAE